MTGRFDRDLATLRDLIAQRRLNPVGIRREDLTTDMERDAFDIWRFMEVQRELGIAGEDEPPTTYEEVLAHLDESGEY